MDSVKEKVLKRIFVIVARISSENDCSRTFAVLFPQYFIFIG
jgi:hypothetical protein